MQPQQDTVSSSQQSPENVDDQETHKSVKKRPLHISSSSDTESDASHLITKHPKKKTKVSSRRLAKLEMPWAADYKKQIACKLCNSLWPSKRSVWNHIRSHEFLKSKFINIFNRQCLIKLEKIDGKPNFTGFNNSVVHSSSKIITTGHNSYFYTVYLKETENSNDSANHLDGVEPENLSNNALNQNSTDDEFIISRPKHRKARIISRSSNETVVIESNKVLSDTEVDSKINTHESIDGRLSNDQCINIADSSESESEEKLDSNHKSKQPMAAKLGDYKIIQGIISMCVNAYHKKYESTDVDLYTNNMQNKKNDRSQVNSESQLKHKVLSIGRKIINKQGFNCTGLLRYMEHKNLEIIWLSKISYSRDTNYIRILTKLRGNDTTDDNHGWVNVSDVGAPEPYNRVLVTNSSVHGIAAPIETSSVANSSKSQLVKDTSELTNIATSQIEQVKEQFKLDNTMPAVLYLDSNATSSDPKKLLNSNPVANPKQLPKKLGLGNESRTHKTAAQQSTSTFHINNNENFVMPFITSTTSLASIQTNAGQNKDVSQNDNNNSLNASVIVTTKETPAPRIKVKPVSELMSERTLNSLMKEQSEHVSCDSNLLTSQIIENVWSQPVSLFVPNVAPQMHVGGQPIQISQMPLITSAYQVIEPPPTTSNNKEDFVVLDTNEFPNKRTECPFQYLKDLLLMHNLVLLDPCDELSREFVCLIKFKVLFKQEAHKDKPVVLCLAIFNFRNTFCLKVRDRFNAQISMNKISANWQWEILQIYRGDVVNKVLENAQKISTETFDYTKNFFSVLKSIAIKKNF